MPTNRFRNTVEKIVNNPELYSKEDLHDLFLEMTERYLNELLSTMNYEKAIIESLGEERGSEVIETAATSNLDVYSVDSDNIEEDDIKNRIINLFNAIEKMQKGDAETDSPLGLN